MQDLITKVTQQYTRNDGSEVKIIAQAMYGAGLHQSIDVYALHRPDASSAWRLLDNRPHPDWRTMSVQEYTERGRSDLLQHVTIGEILKVKSLIGKPMSVLH